MKRSLPVDNSEKVVKYRCDDEDLGYDFKCFKKEDFDLMVYMVTCTDDPKPWTVIVSNFSNNGHLRFFAQLWRAGFPRCMNDVKFLWKAWKELGMQGDCNLDLVAEYSKQLADTCFREDWIKVFESRYNPQGVEIENPE